LIVGLEKVILKRKPTQMSGFLLVGLSVLELKFIK
jgi:hypothetical protein